MFKQGWIFLKELNEDMCIFFLSETTVKTSDADLDCMTFSLCIILLLNIYWNAKFDAIYNILDESS